MDVVFFLEQLLSDLFNFDHDIHMTLTPFSAGIIEDQRQQAEERGNKLKQLLVKAKKDIADAKKLETEQRSSDAQLRGQMELLQQTVEDLKVGIWDTL